MKLGILIFDTGNYPDLEFIFDYATLADDLGYSRFWFGNHYDGQPNKAWCNPEMLLPVVAGMTEQISVGVAGMLLRLENPYRLALNFKMLHNLFHNRIDFGIAGGSAFDVPSLALTNFSSIEEVQSVSIADWTKEILYYFRNEPECNQKGLYIAPCAHGSPDPWMLSTSTRRYETALDLKMHYSRSLFHIAGDDKAAGKQETLEFIEKFTERHGSPPDVNISFACVLGDTVEDANARFQKTYFSEPESHFRTNFIGTPEGLVDQLAEWEKMYGVNEFVLLDLDFNLERRKSNIKEISRLLKNRAHAVNKSEIKMA